MSIIRTKFDVDVTDTRYLYYFYSIAHWQIDVFFIFTFIDRALITIILVV